MSHKSRVLVVGGGAIGAMTAFNLEAGGSADVTAVLRSNAAVVRNSGFTIDSCDHGTVSGWKPSAILSDVRDVFEKQQRSCFDYIVCTTKNTPDILPSLVDTIKCAITPGETVIVLIQNGINIEEPFLREFPTNVCLSGVSFMSAHQTSPGRIKHTDTDRLIIGPFLSTKIDRLAQETAAKQFVALYSASNKVKCWVEYDVPTTRWRKLMYNAVWNPVCALTGLDTSRIRILSGEADGANPVDSIIRPAMEEIRFAAKAAAGVDLPTSLTEAMINCDPLEIFCQPSMLQDRAKSKPIEYETLVGNALREGEKAGVKMPTLRCIYVLCKALQWSIMETNGILHIPQFLELQKNHTPETQAQS